MDHRWSLPVDEDKESLYHETTNSRNDSVTDFAINNRKRGHSAVSNVSVKSLSLHPIKEDDAEVLSSRRQDNSNNQSAIKNYRVELEIEKHRIKRALAPEYEAISSHLKTALNRLCGERS
jgi:hypothetical protein